MRSGYALVVFAAVAIGLPRLAHAQIASEMGSDARLWIGGDLKVSPLGTYAFTGPDRAGSSDLNTMVSAGALLDFRALPFFSVGIAPAVIFNFKFGNNGMLLDLPARVTLGAQVASGTRLYAFGTAGYTHSIAVPLSDLDPSGSFSASGLVAGAGGGAALRIGPKLAVTGEVAYQLHFLTASIFDDEHVDLSLHLRCLSLSLGLVGPID